MQAKQVLIVSPATARENNGNWQTASRWASMLGTHHHVAIADTFRHADPDLLIALHARRSADAITSFARTWPARPVVVVLTGTDLYRDLATSPEARASLELATRIVLLQAAGLALLPAHLQHKARVIYQSAPAIAPPPPRAARTTHDISMIGHLRAEKDPATFMLASALVTSPSARLLHIGRALDPALAEAATATQVATPRYHWLGEQPHEATRAHLAASHAMVLCSLMEGGANVIIEAVTSGVPVLASDISGNRGMLGEDYAGYFPVGDARGLAALIDRSIDDPHFDSHLRAQCAARATLFAPDTERAHLLDLVDNLF